MLETVAISVGAACLASLINWLFSRPAEHVNQLHNIDKRLVQAEARVESVFHRQQKADDSIDEIKENMVRKSDLIHLEKRIDEIVTLLVKE